MKFKRVWFPFVRYYNPSLFSSFLHEMALAGWFPKAISLLSYFCITFVNAERKEYHFSVDFNLIGSKDYLAFYESFRWIHLGRMSNLNIWYRESDELEPSDIYTEDESKIRNAGKYAVFLWAGIIPPFLAFATLFVMLIIGGAHLTPWVLIAYSLLCICLFGLTIIVVIQYIKFVRSIREKNNE